MVVNFMFYTELFVETEEVRPERGMLYSETIHVAPN